METPGFKYHHLGIPTTVPRQGERHLPEQKVFVSGFEESPFGVEWMRFEPGCDLPELVQTVPHVAFEVDDLAEALAGRQVLIAPNSPSPGVTVAFVVDHGAPVEFLEFRQPGDVGRTDEVPVSRSESPVEFPTEGER